MASSVLVRFTAFLVVVITSVHGVLIEGQRENTPRCEFSLSSHTVRCYSLANLTVLERFIEDDRPVKVQVINGPLDKFHLGSARDFHDDGAPTDASYATRDFYSRIKELDLSEAGQLVIQEDMPAFRRMRKLKSLIVSNSGISRLQPMWFSGMDHNQITYVDASENQIQRLNLSQETLPLLQVLNVSHNDIHEVDLRDFMGLESLILSMNQLSDLEFLQKFRNLHNLCLDNNDLKMVRTQDFQNHRTLEHLNLAINFISQVEVNSFDKLMKLRHLNMSHNLLSGLQFFTILTQLNALEVLDVTANQIVEVPSLQLFKMNNLRVLNMSRNFITEIPEKSFSGLFSLRHLNLQGNQIKSIDPNAFNQLFDLEYLDLSSNKLQQVDGNLFTIPSRKLKRLFLQNNQLTSLPDSIFLNTRKLIQLDLSRNKLKELPEFLFKEMGNLRVLHLEHNSLTTFSMAQLQQNLQLRVVFLHHNQLTHIDEFNRGTLGRLAKVTILTIDNNPWQCACMDQMIALLSKTKINYSYEAGYFENEKRQIMCVVTEECYANLVDRHEKYIRELYFGQF